jgi:OOP family OmpA-OmpF porin
MTITIVGHTDNEGTTAYNKKLSEDRANTVMRYFAKKGITADRMRAIGKGDTTPIADNSKAAGRAQNRRIEIEFADPEPNVVCK